MIQNNTPIRAMTVKVLEPLDEFGELREIVKVDKTPHQLFEAI